MNGAAPLSPPPALLYEPLLLQALREDLGGAGDLTTDAVVPAEETARAQLALRAEGVVAGLPIALRVFELLDPRGRATVLHRDGEAVAAGTVVARLEGPARALLAGERVALNLLGRLSGIATATRRLVAAVAPYPVRVACTRKTTPGLRTLEKYAVRAGGGSSHRFGLDDAVLIKDNHRHIAGGVVPAVERVRRSVGHLVKVEVEVDTLDELDQALSCPIDAVLLDNMPVPVLEEAVRRCRRADPRVAIEASGGITLETAAAVAATGVDVLSVGWLTHSAPALDVTLDVEV